jgi:predicted HTH transcriptional regulator
MEIPSPRYPPGRHAACSEPGERRNVPGQVKDPKLEHVIVKTIAGLMNAEGGTLLIGLDDNGHMLGLQPGC